jgi:prefoldin subunit 5
LIDETLNEVSYRGSELPSKSGTGIEQEVKILYARGEIDSGTYHRLMEMAQNGQLGWDDLNRVERKSLASATQEQPSPRKRDAEIVGHLNKLYSHRKQLEKSRQETENVLQTLEKEASRLQDQARVAEEKAQQTIADEEVARAYLQTRQETLERASAVQERMDDLRQNLGRIERLEADLATREAELKALESGEQLAELEANIRQDLLGDE